MSGPSFEEKQERERLLKARSVLKGYPDLWLRESKLWTRTLDPWPEAQVDPSTIFVFDTQERFETATEQSEPDAFQAGIYFPAPDSPYGEITIVGKVEGRNSPAATFQVKELHQVKELLTKLLVVGEVEQKRWEPLNESLASGRAALALIDVEDLQTSREDLNAVFDRAAQFTKLLWATALDRSQEVPPTPILTGLNEGTVDVYFKNDRLNLVINFERGEPSAYAGERHDGTIGGTASTDTTTVGFLAAWLLGQ